MLEAIEQVAEDVLSEQERAIYVQRLAVLDWFSCYEADIRISMDGPVGASTISSWNGSGVASNTKISTSKEYETVPALFTGLDQYFTFYSQ